MKDMITTAAISIFFAMGGVAILLHAVAKLAPEKLKAGLSFLINKYPPVKQFCIDHGDDLKAIIDALAEAEKAAIDDAKKDPPKT